MGFSIATRKIVVTVISFVMLVSTAMMMTVDVNAAYSTKVPAIKYVTKRGTYNIPKYDGDPYEKVCKNNPKFGKKMLIKKAKENYGKLDSRGRVKAAKAILNRKLMPTYSRGSISSIYPTGWVQKKYSTSLVPGGYLWNRSHLIAFMFTGVDNEHAKKQYAKRDLITGTRYFNAGSGAGGMLTFENKIAGYLRSSAKHYVAYRVTPIYRGSNLVASGVLMEAESVGDDSIEFCVFIYNVQPGIAIDYATGDSRKK